MSGENTRSRLHMGAYTQEAGAISPQLISKLKRGASMHQSSELVKLKWLVDVLTLFDRPAAAFFLSHSKLFFINVLTAEWLPPSPLPPPHISHSTRSCRINEWSKSMRNRPVVIFTLSSNAPPRWQSRHTFIWLSVRYVCPCARLRARVCVCLCVRSEAIDTLHKRRSISYRAYTQTQTHTHTHTHIGRQASTDPSICWAQAFFRLAKWHLFLEVVSIVYWRRGLLDTSEERAAGVNWWPIGTERHVLCK